MENEAEVIKTQMEETRSSLSDKLGALEQQVSTTVKETTAAVAETVENVKDVVETTTTAVADTVESVKDAFDLSGHVQRHPWGVMGGSAAVGFLFGWLTTPTQPRYAIPPQAAALANTVEKVVQAIPGTVDKIAKAAEGTVDKVVHAASQAGEGVVDKVAHAASQVGQGAVDKAAHAAQGLVEGAQAKFQELWGPLLEQAKSLVLGASTGVIGEMVLKMLPADYQNDLSDLLNRFTQAVGGTVLRPQKQEDAHANGHPRAEGAPNGKQADHEQRAEQGSKGRVKVA